VIETSASLPDWLWFLCTVIAIIGSAYAAMAAALIRRLARKTVPTASSGPPVTVLKPLHGAETSLETNLASFGKQNYLSSVEVICGVADSGDPAADVVRKLASSGSATAFVLVEDPAQHGANRKISNLINMMKLRHYDMLALSDSDMRVGPDYLGQIMAPFEDASVGLVTCYYRGLPAGGFWSRLAATHIDHHFLPSALVGTCLGLAQPSFGSTIAVNLKILNEIGGFEAFADKLADDYEMGRAVRKAGKRIAIPPMLIAHVCSDSSFAEVFHHELRWVRTVRLIDPAGYLGSIVTHPLPFALAAAFLHGFDATSSGFVALTLACRSAVPLEMKRGFQAEGSSVWLGPIRDLLSFTVFLASFLPIAVSWRGRRYRVNPDGTMKPT
jgi:ceramide glucosyltransferase